MNRLPISIFLTVLFTAGLGASAVAGQVFTGIACAAAALGWAVVAAYVIEDEK